MKVNEVGRILQYDSARVSIWFVRFIAVIIPGLIFGMFVSLSPLLTSEIRIRSSNTPFQRAFALGTFMILISSLVESLKYTIYEMSLWTFVIFGSMGILCSLLKVREEKR